VRLNPMSLRGLLEIPSRARTRPGLTRPLALGLLAGVAAVACARHEARPVSEAPAGPPVATESAAVFRSGGDAELAVPGTVQARQRAALSARIPASVVELPYREGDRVAAGAVLVRLDDAALKSAVAAAEAGLKAAESDLSRTEALLKKGAATPREQEDAASRAAGARAALSGARDQLSYAVLRAPFSGTVSARPVNLGDVAGPGHALIEIEGDGGLELRATVESDVVGSLRPGLKLRARVDGQDAPLDAVVRVVSSAGDQSTHRFEVRADLPAATGLRSGLFARLLLPVPSQEARLLAPARAVFRRGGLHGVYVIAEGRARLRWVAVGETSGESVEIRSGVLAGERVALDPAGLSDGARVEDAPRAAGSASPAKGPGSATPRPSAR
jgi:membrane fusion protein, multidrug efflux system